MQNISHDVPHVIWLWKVREYQGSLYGIGYLEGEEPTVERLKATLRKATCECTAVPVCCGSAYRNKGVQKLLDAILEYMPAPTDIPPIEGVDLDGNPCGELEEQHIAHARQQLEEAKARVQAQRAAQQAKKREAAAAAGQQDEGVRRERKPRPQQPRRKEGAEQRKPRPVAAKAPREERLTPVSDVSVLTVGQALKVKAGNNAMDATVLEITKDGVRVQLTSGMSMIVRAEHLVF